MTRWTIIFYYIFDYIELTTLLACCPFIVLICEMAQEIKVMMMEVRIDKETGCFIQCTMRLPSCNYCAAEVGNEVAAMNNLSHWDDAGSLSMVASGSSDLEHLQVLIKC